MVQEDHAERGEAVMEKEDRASGRATHEPSPDGLGHSVGIPDAETWTCRCVDHQIKAMMAMNETSLDMPVLSFATIAEWSGLTLTQTKTAVRALAERGVAEYWRTCWSDDGEPRGAGYALTAKGRTAAWQVELHSAQGMEAGTAETQRGSVHDSPVGNADAPKEDLRAALMENNE